MASDKFCRELRGEAQRWREDGLISDDQFRQLAQQYQFEELNTAARDRFVMILLGLGSLLVGIGAITFVAANWQALSQTIKAGILFTAMVMADLSGFALVNRIAPNNRWQRLGQALLLLGALLLGANLALMGQIVHTSGTRYELCAAWALGVLAMAYGVRLPFLAMLALLLLGIGYWSAFWDMMWLQAAWLGVWTLQMMPLIVTALFLPLAYRCRSQWLFALTAIAMTSSLFVLILDVGRSLPPLLEALSLILPYALLWAYDDTLWGVGRRWVQGRFSLGEAVFLGPAVSSSTRPRPFPPQAADRPFQPIARGLMLFSLSVFYWVVSFQDAWLVGVGRELPAAPLQWQDTWLMVLLLLLFSAWTALSWGYLGWRPGRPGRLDSLSAVLLVFLLITAGVFFWALVAGPIPIVATTVFNILLALMALGMMREGLGAGSRLPFWWGLVMLTLQILSRVLEYETGLLIKSLVFVVCGIAVILVGLWFERYVRTLRVDSA
ncbi:MAG: DUF2157 domain-containing protein [Leptolyngbya sp. SIO1E4]|nr:DUF2157 domain-containing protein [Leptolyngbya sp. SIO1E4]